MSKINKIGYWVSANIWLICWFVSDSSQSTEPSFSLVLGTLIFIFGPYIYLINKGIEENYSQKKNCRTSERKATDCDQDGGRSPTYDKLTKDE